MILIPASVKRKRETSQARKPSTQLLKINNLPWILSDEELLTTMAKHGEVEFANVAKAKGTGQPLGYGFVKYKDLNDEKKVLALQEFVIRGRCVSILPKI